MSYWLVKTEPDEFSYTDLERLGRDRWNGVRNFTAIKHLNQMRPGDLIFIYHTGDEKSIVGVAAVVRSAYPDPTSQDDRFIAVDLEARYRLLKTVALKQIKADPSFADWELVRQPRLSVMPVRETHWLLIQQLSSREPYG